MTTEWPLYRNIDWLDARAAMTGSTVFDVRQIVDMDAASPADMVVIVHARPVETPRRFASASRADNG